MFLIDIGSIGAIFEASRAEADGGAVVHAGHVETSWLTCATPQPRALRNARKTLWRGAKDEAFDAGAAGLVPVVQSFMKPWRDVGPSLTPLRTLDHVDAATPLCAYSPLISAFAARIAGLRR